MLRETILSSQEISLKTLQRFGGKTTSFAIAVPASRLYSRVCYRTIGAAGKRPCQPIRVIGELRKEIQYWRFLDSWTGCLPWFDENHQVVSTFTDASDSGWGAVLHWGSEDPQHIRDYWSAEEKKKPIVIREALALLHALRSWGGTLRNSRVEVRVDSQPVVQAWKNQGGKSCQLSDVIKSIYETALSYNLALTLSFVPSSENLADQPSRSLSAQDCMLSSSSWKKLQDIWGPHSIDLMALDSNAQRDYDGLPLPHYTPWLTEFSAGVNVFAQHISTKDNAYVFPPLVLVGPLLRFLFSMASFRVTFVVPAVQPCRYWWPLISKQACGSLQLGCRGDEDVLLFPSLKEGFATGPLPWDLWAFRLIASDI